MTVLPQGAPTSPYLANLLATGMDRRFQGYANKNSLRYTRYADDRTISGDRQDLPSTGLVVHIVCQEGFFVNFSKLKRCGPARRKVVTGLIINEGVHIPKVYKRNIRRHLYYARKFGVVSHLSKIGCDKKAFADWLLGSIHYINSVEPNVAEEMLKEYSMVQWLI